MNAKTLAVVLLAILALFAAGCTQQDSGSYQPPSGPVGGGCGIQMPAEPTVDAAEGAASSATGAL
ncbi:hypothetical protein HYU14_02430 [Candidatus Woesearchaeota archaeon]|nr:hypothetical protein [Candidatus Woesearchaeota archaeon]